MADEQDDTEKSEDPTQKRLDEALERGDVVKSQEVNTWFVLAAATLILLSFSGSMSSGLTDHAARPARATRTTSRSTGAASCSTMQTLGHRAPSRRSRCRSLLLVLAAIAGNMIQHRLVWSAESLKPKLSQDLAGGGLQAAVLQAGAGELRQGPDQARADRRGHDVCSCGRSATGSTAWSRWTRRSCCC